MFDPILCYVVFSFVDSRHLGNPAAVCMLDHWLDDKDMQQIAYLNQFSETAFIVFNKEFYEIRWFTPTVEVDICGHATLAAAWVVFSTHSEIRQLIFKSNTDLIEVFKKNEWIRLKFPIYSKFEKEFINKTYRNIFGDQIINIVTYQEWILFEFRSEEEIQNYKINIQNLEQIYFKKIIITAPSKNYDFVYRFFAPKCGITEDPATGSAQCLLAPYWQNITSKNNFKSAQLSERGGVLQCFIEKDYLFIQGLAKMYLKGKIFY